MPGEPVRYVAPLCPAGHLPHLGGDWLAARLVLVLRLWRLAKPVMRADLPPSGGDVRQDRGGQHGAQSFERLTRLTTWLCFLTLALCLLFPLAPAFAHSALIASSPADGAVVQTAPRQFSLAFNEPVSPLVLKLVRPDGSSLPLDRYALENATLVIDVPQLGEGTHVLVWRIVSADGHPVGGSLVFSIGAPSAGGPPDAMAPGSRTVQAALWLGKTTLYAGLFFGVGGAFFLAWIGPASGRAKGLVLGALRLGLVAALLSVGLQGLDALDLSLTALVWPAIWDVGFGTSYGYTATAALLALLGAIASLSLPWQAISRTLALLALVGVGVALAASGHAADATPHWLTRPAVFLHAVGIACWVGALPPLAFLLSARGPDAAAALRRFSRLIPYPIAAMVIAGIVLAVIQVQSPQALVATSYGQLLMAKLAIVAALFVLAMRNRWRLTAAGGERGRWRRWPHWRAPSGSRSCWSARPLPSPRCGASRHRRAC